MPSIFDIVGSHAETDPSRLALITERDGVRTYGQLVDTAAALGSAMHEHLGLQPGDRVCLWTQNRPEWVETYVACGAAGLTTVLGNPEWTDYEIGYVFDNSEATAVVCDAALAARAVALKATHPKLRHVIALTDDTPTADGAISYDALLASAPPDARRHLPAAAATTASASFMYTSGTTTGRPKAVVQRGAAGQAADYYEMFGLQPRDRAMVITPFFHGNGFGGVLAALSYGASVVFPRRFSARGFWPLVDLHRPTYLWTLAPLVNILLGQPPAHHERTHAFRVLIVLGSGPNAPLIEERYGAPVIDWYGMTEAGSGTYTRLDMPRKPGSAGTPFPGSGIMIMKEDGTEAAVGEVGEVVYPMSSLTFEGYANDAEATAAAIKDGYFHTGDLGYFDADRYFFFVDRKKDIVRRGGENISSMEIEAVMRQHPHVAEAAIVAKPDPVLGERVSAFVVPAEGLAGGPDTESIRAFVAERLAHFKVPEEIHVVPEFDRTPTGKIEKFRLRQKLSEMG